MEPHRYVYLYRPIVRFLRTLPPEKQILLLIAKAGLILFLILFDLAYLTNAL